MQSTILSVAPNARNHGDRVDIYPINYYIYNMKKGRALLHKCFALNVPEVSYEAGYHQWSVRAFAPIEVRARKL